MSLKAEFVTTPQVHGGGGGGVIFKSLVRRDFFVAIVPRRQRKAETTAGQNNLYTDLISHAYCSRVVILYVQCLALAEKLFVVDVWSLMFGVSRITWPYLIKEPNRSTFNSTIIDNLTTDVHQMEAIQLG